MKQSLENIQTFDSNQSQYDYENKASHGNIILSVAHCRPMKT